MAYNKKPNYPSFKKPGVYPPSTDKELGLNSDNLEKFSLGNWNSISKSNRKYFVSTQGGDENPSFLEDLYESGIYLGRPVRVKLVDIDPVLTWTLVSRVGGFNSMTNLPSYGGYDSDIIVDDWGEVYDLDGIITDERRAVNHIPEQAYYSNSSDWKAGGSVSENAQVGPLMPLSRFVDDYETSNVKRMRTFYRTFHHTYKRSDEDTYVVPTTDSYTETTTADSDHYLSLAVREQIVEIFQDKQEQLKNVIDGQIGYIRELNPDDYDGIDDFEIPIQLTFKTNIQSQIDEILSFNVEVYANGRGGMTQAVGVDFGDSGGFAGNWYHRFKLYFGSYNYTLSSVVQGYSNFDDNDRAVSNDPPSGVFSVNDTYLPEDSYVLSDESPIEYWGGIYFKKLTDDGSIIKIGDAHEYGFGSPKTGFTNTGRVGISPFRFGFTYDALLDFMGEFEGPFYGLESGQSGRDVLEERLTDIAHPFYVFNSEALTNVSEFGGEEQTDITGSLDYEVKGLTESSDIDFLYYDVGDKYDETSYPVKMELNMGLYGIELNENSTGGGSYSSIDQFYLGEYNPIINIDTSFENGTYTYSVLQWGDEKNLLTDDQILNSEYFYLYTAEEVPTPDNYYYKRIVQNKSSQLNFTLNSFHVYNIPGVKTIKIIVYRYDSTGNILLQTTLVTKNIVINDGNLTSQDFSIFGGTDFNFLPLKDNQVIIGGLDEDSKYNNSVEKIVKDDNFIEDDYLERASSTDFIDNFNKKLYGETPGQLDLSTTRMYKKPLDIYDFITNDKQSIVDNNFNINTLPINSSATDIFISNNDCIVDLNPQDIEYLSIQNKTGTADKAILIGDYKVNQPKDGKIQRQGVMETPLLEQNTDKQAF